MSSLHLKKLPASGHTHSLHHTRHTHNLVTTKIWKHYTCDKNVIMQTQNPTPEPMPLNWYPAVLQSTCPLCWKQYHPCKFICRFACPTCSVKTGQMATNEGFPFLLAFSNKRLQLKLQRPATIWRRLLPQIRAKLFDIAAGRNWISTITLQMSTLQLCTKQAFLRIIHRAQTHIKKNKTHISFPI